MMRDEVGYGGMGKVKVVGRYSDFNGPLRCPKTAFVQLPYNRKKFDPKTAG